MDLRFMGDLPWWQGLMMAIVASAAAWWLYRRETTSQSRRVLKWLLPTLRAATDFLVVMILTGPVLHHRQVIGQLGRVLVFLDASQSMSIVDPETSAGRKLLVAQSRGWLPEGTIDPALRETADTLAQSVRQSAEGQRPGSSIEVLGATTRQFADQMANVHTRLTAIPADRIPAPPLRSGSVLREYWTNINGGSLNELRSLFDSGKPATGHDFLNRFESPANWADNHAQRISGFVYPPATGAYQFWIACDDAAALYLSVDDNPANKQRVALLESFSPRGQWPEGSARSAPIQLEAGRAYYIEAEHKEGNGEDFVAVGWTLPDGTQERPIPGHRLATPNPEGGTSHFAAMVARFGQDVARTARTLADEPLNADNQIQIRGRLVALVRAGHLIL